MKAIIFLATIAFAAADTDYYNSKKLDIEKLYTDPDEFKTFMDCLLDRKECSALHATFRAIAQEAIEQLCKRCSPYQKHVFWMWLQVLTSKFPQDYESFKQKYDPENKYFDNLESDLKKYSIEY